ncbi:MULTISPECIES: MucR family transcriptional regulator, partial [unclassified Mesorhizobium]
IVSLEDGRKFKSMKRHLGLLGMTPDEYRAKWGLARDYPMVAPSYAAQRSELAKSSGLGRKAVAKTRAKKAPTRQKAKV